MKKASIIIALSLLLVLAGCGRSSKGRYVVILSMDGFRWDLPQMYHTPTLDSVAKVGVSAVIRPVYPSMTLPNHYSMATGLWPDHHGIVNNTFYDSELDTIFAVGRYDTRSNAALYGGEPIWNTAARQGLLCNVFDWIGVEAPVGGKYPAYSILYDPNRTRKQMADLVLEALCKDDVKQIPQLVMWYIDEPDKSEHYYSAESPQVRDVVENIDSVLSYFLSEVRSSPVYDKIDFIFTADHGHTDLSPEKYLNLYSSIGHLVERCDNQTPLGIVPREGCVETVMDSLAMYAPGRYRYWPRENLPAEFRFGTFASRIAPIIVQPDLGWKIVCDANPEFKKPQTGNSAHGYDPKEDDMQMVFYGFGPHFKRGYVHDRQFRTADDYLIMCKLLGIKPAPNDCCAEDVEGLFK